MRFTLSCAWIKNKVWLRRDQEPDGFLRLYKDITWKHLQHAHSETQQDQGSGWLPLPLSGRWTGLWVRGRKPDICASFTEQYQKIKKESRTFTSRLINWMMRKHTPRRKHIRALPPPVNSQTEGDTPVTPLSAHWSTMCHVCVPVLPFGV